MKKYGQFGNSLLLAVFLTLCGLSLPGGLIASGWEQLGLSGMQAGHVAIHPDTPDTIFVVSGDSLFRSMDGGSTFAAVFGDPNGFDLTDVAVSPLSPQNVLVGDVGNVLGSNAHVFFSTNAGASWNQFSKTFRSIRDIEPDPAALTDFYVVTDDTLFKRDQVVLEHGGGDLAICPTDNQFLALGVGDTLGVGISTDGGGSWTYYNSGLPVHRTTEISVIAMHPTDCSRMFLGVQTGVNPTSYYGYLTVDGGETYTETDWSYSRVSDAVIDPTVGASGIAFGGSVQGVFRMPFDMLSWSAINEGLEGDARSVNGIAAVTGQALYAGTNDGIWKLDYLPALSFAARNLDDTAGGNGNGLPEGGEQIAVSVFLYNTMFLAQGLTGSLTTDDAYTVIDDGSADFPDIQALAASSNSTDPFLVTISDQAPHAHRIDFDLVLSSNGGNFTDTLSFSIAVSRNIVLLMDDDEGNSFETYYTTALDTLDMTDSLKNIYDRWDVRMYGPATDILQAPWAHDPVIWFTGNATANTLTDDDQTLIQAYLDNGGDMMITGQNIAEDLQGSNFLTTYLGIDWLQNIADPISHGVPGDPLSGNIHDIVTQGTKGANNQTSRDELTIPVGAASPAISVVYDTTTYSIAGVRIEKEGTGERNGRCFFLGFGFEAVNRPAGSYVTRAEMMYDILNWLRVPVGIGDEPGETGGAIPKVFALGQNYPNPFNPQTSIAFTVPGNEGENVAVSLRVYSIRGRLVKTLVDDTWKPGNHTVIWNGRDESGKKASSGIYFYRLEAGDRVAVKKMVILK